MCISHYHIAGNMADFAETVTLYNVVLNILFFNKTNLLFYIRMVILPILLWYIVEQNFLISFQIDWHMQFQAKILLN